MRNTKVSLVIGIILLIFLAGCSAVQGTKQTPTAKASDPKFTADTGAIKVTLISSYTGKALGSADIYCAQMLEMKGTLTGVYIPSLDRLENPKGITDGNGALAISNAKPGKYVLVYMFPAGLPELIKASDTKKDVVFDVTAGQITDLGVLTVDVNPEKMNNN